MSIPVTDLPSARAFYGALLGCTEERYEEGRIDFDFFGLHVVTHVEAEEAAHVVRKVGSHGVRVPVRHFGVVLPMEEWTNLADRLTSHKAEFVIPPKHFGSATVPDHMSMLVADGCGNVVEFKGQATA
jgi:extradiol dioxygenase family protein